MTSNKAKKTESHVKKEITLFDFEAGLKRRDEGKNLAANNRAEVLSLARLLASWIALHRESRECTADDVQSALIARGRRPEELGNAAGSIFRGKQWRYSKKIIQSTRVSNNGRTIKIWEYVGKFDQKEL